MYRARWSHHPSLFKTLQELHESIATIDVKTKLGEDFLLVNDDDNNIVIFSMTKNLTFFAKYQTVLVDGTFYSCPRLFYQLFTMNDYRNRQYVPFAFHLLRNKEETTYETTFSSPPIFRKSITLPQSMSTAKNLYMTHCVRCGHNHLSLVVVSISHSHGMVKCRNLA